ncbi:hypothetical protein VNI00_000968 [Paramarasmius palmivorus]|uniref:Pentatricopeptide repeat-containing protein n=1 Tax=Paramarasmius palmivorus TaxID=297713 RepID=A0AAW0E4Y9_9AGAR
MLRAFSLGSITQVQRIRLPLRISWRIRKYSVGGVGRVKELPPHQNHVKSGGIRKCGGTLSQGIERQQPHPEKIQQDTIEHDTHQTLAHPPFVTGKSRYRLPIPSLYGGKIKYGKKFVKSDPFYDKEQDPETEKESLYYHLLHIIASTQDHKKAYDAYGVLVNLPHPHPQKSNEPKIPYSHLHRLLRLLATQRPKTRSQFLRILSVMSTLHASGGRLQTWQWNALISHAGTGWRKARAQDWRLALNTYDDMMSGLSPGTSFSGDYANSAAPYPQATETIPDLYTYNTLLSIAAKTLYGRAVKRASTLTTNVGLTPDRITHLSMLNFWIGVRQLYGMRNTLLQMRIKGLELGLDGANTCIWGYSVLGELNVVRQIYKVLRANLAGARADVEVQIEEMLKDEGIYIDPAMIPNEVTYTATIQSMAYHGDLQSALQTFMDMLQADNIEPGASVSEKGEYLKYAPTYAVFRALFLGFARHGHAENGREGQAWDLGSLEEIYGMYMRSEEIIEMSQWMVYWILTAFNKCSGHDVMLLRRVWAELERRKLGTNFGGPNNRLTVLKDIVFQDNVEEAKRYLEEVGFRVMRNEDTWDDGDVSW